MKIGLVGVGHLGKIHLKCLQKTEFNLVGFFDPNTDVQQEIVQSFGIRSFSTLEELMENSDCIDIVSPTSFHYEIATKAISKGKHVFIEKPLTETITQAEHLVRLAKEHNVVVQVGHVERYNPAIRSLKNVHFEPKFIEAHRLAMFNVRGTDVSVVLDLMIHDIDIILSMIKSKVLDVRATGVCIVSKTPDICNARIEFENGAVANLTASRISLKNMRKIRIFQKDAYISLDFLSKDAQVVKIENADENNEISGMTLSTNDGLKRITIDQPDIMQNNAIEDELNDFYLSVVEGKPVSVTIDDGYKALNLAYLIEEKLQNQNEL